MNFSALKIQTTIEIFKILLRQNGCRPRLETGQSFSSHQTAKSVFGNAVFSSLFKHLLTAPRSCKQAVESRPHGHPCSGRVGGGVLSSTTATTTAAWWLILATPFRTPHPLSLWIRLGVQQEIPSILVHKLGVVFFFFSGKNKLESNFQCLGLGPLTKIIDPSLRPTTETFPLVSIFFASFSEADARNNLRSILIP